MNENSHTPQADPAPKAQGKGDPGIVNERAPAAPGWEARRFRQGDEAGIMDLFRRVFGQERSPDEWHWKFRAGPPEHPRFIHLACDRDRIVGQMAALSTRFLVRGREFLAVQPVDNMIHPEYRRGLGKSRMQRVLLRGTEEAALEAGMALGYGFPNPEAYRIGTRLLGYLDLGAIPVRQRSLTWGRHARRLVGNIRMAERLAWLQARTQRSFLQARVPSAPGVTVRRLDRFDDRFDRLWEKASRSFGMLAVRDRRFLAWRYGERPGRRYTVLALDRDGDLLGYAVLSLREGQVRTGFVADLFCLPGEGWADCLLAASIRHFLEENLDLAECWCPGGGRYEGAIRQAFPRTLPEPVRVVFKIYHESVDLRFAGDLANWHLTMGDSDGV